MGSLKKEQFYTRREIDEALKKALASKALEKVYAGEDVSGMKEAKEIIDQLLLNLVRVEKKSP